MYNFHLTIIEAQLGWGLFISSDFVLQTSCFSLHASVFVLRIWTNRPEIFFCFIISSIREQSFLSCLIMPRTGSIDSKIWFSKIILQIFCGHATLFFSLIRPFWPEISSKIENIEKPPCRKSNKELIHVSTTYNISGTF